jgi:hypothetical protein
MPVKRIDSGFRRRMVQLEQKTNARRTGNATSNGNDIEEEGLWRLVIMHQAPRRKLQW